MNDYNYFMNSSISEIEDNTNATDVDNDDTSIHKRLGDLEINSDYSDIWLDSKHA